MSKPVDIEAQSLTDEQRMAKGATLLLASQIYRERCSKPVSLPLEEIAAASIHDAETFMIAACEKGYSIEELIQGTPEGTALSMMGGIL